MTLTPVYTPPPGLRTALADFKDYVNSSYGLQLQTYEDLHAFSINRLNDFWMATWRFLGIKASVHPEKAVDENAPIDQFPLFFEEARLNFAENMLCGEDDQIAVIDVNEENLWTPRRYTWRQLRHLVHTYTNALRRTGVAKGDVVALIGSNCVRSLGLLLATSAVGGIFASFATDIGDKALNDRLGQIEPRVVFAESSYSYNGKRIDITTKVDGCTSKASQPLKLVVIGDTAGFKTKCENLETFIKDKDPQTPLNFEQVPFNTPLVIMFSSGTTGTPKGIVHSHGGLLLNGFKEHRLHNGFGPQDIHFHFSGIGWTLWNISIGALFCKTTMVLYDGSPFYPTPDEFLRGILATGITGFGAGPRYYAELQKRNFTPKTYAKEIHTIFSTGAVLTPSLASWLGEAFGPVCQIQFTGGTELCGSFIHGTRLLPAYPGEIAMKALGMDVAAYSPDGSEVPDGESGELVCRKPFPNMPVMFWNDPGKKRYYNAYFDMFPHVWTHGDFIKVNPVTRGTYVLGRSDGTLNPSGVRFGSSEIYNILSSPHFASSIIDSLVVGQQRSAAPYSDTTERVLLFIKCREGESTNHLLPNKDLDSRIRDQIARDLSRRHVPAHIFEVKEIPYNANGKKMEIQVKAVVNGGAQAKTKQRLSQHELSMLEQFEPFFHLEKLLNKLERCDSKL
ncbi:acetoacetate-CoA ligase [Cladophialophora psammophila CBS 110553]|uniref:Acetoacetate-CoA ligase n=1 Tax=Cladophialophora psammophila CBS 110553 TaxID=1182543 RepID=W9VSB2_9EURO|nr:acetoacetate-CoA ligase [Cladophialophora psammophila CBS 110553]EXJ55066.1 acetoacetate-CoA ligase [Cladophialophora psammophila CBS 110553]